MRNVCGNIITNHYQSTISFIIIFLILIPSHGSKIRGTTVITKNTWKFKKERRKLKFMHITVKSTGSCVLGYYLGYIRMFKLVPNSNFLCKSRSQRSYFSIWPMAFFPPVKELNWEKQNQRLIACYESRRRASHTQVTLNCSFIQFKLKAAGITSLASRNC